MDLESLKAIEGELRSLFAELSSIQEKIRTTLRRHADGKTLKGDEVVGWLGEIFGKYFLGGHLVDDTYEHDVETPDGLRVSVKTRKGEGSGWNRTSAIPKINGAGCPSHLLFIHLSSQYAVQRMWLYPWKQMVKGSRFRKHMVRGQMRSYYFLVDERRDEKYLVFDARP